MKVTAIATLTRGTYEKVFSLYIPYDISQRNIVIEKFGTTTKLHIQNKSKQLNRTLLLSLEIRQKTK